MPNLTTDEIEGTLKRAMREHAVGAEAPEGPIQTYQPEGVEPKGSYAIAILNGTTLELVRTPGEVETYVHSENNELDVDAKPGWYDFSALLEEVAEALEPADQSEAWNYQAALRDIRPLRHNVRGLLEQGGDPLKFAEGFAKRVREGIQKYGVENERAGAQQGWSFEDCAEEAHKEAEAANAAPDAARATGFAR